MSKGNTLESLQDWSLDHLSTAPIPSTFKTYMSIV